MTVLTIGRVGLDFDLDGVTQWVHDGEELSITVEVYSSLEQALAVRQQILGYVDSPDQLFVPVTWSEEPAADGYYRVESASVTPGTFGRDVFTLDVTLTRVQGYAMPAIQTTYLFHERTTVHDPSPVAGLSTPNTATRWDYTFEPEDGTYSNQPSWWTSSSEDGGVRTIIASVSGGSGPNVGELATWTRVIDPGGYYVGSARLEVNGFPVEGRQLPSDWASSWRLTNGLVELQMDASGVSGGDAIFQMRGWNGSAWVDATPVTLLGDDSATPPRDPFNDPETLTILKNTPEEVILRFVLRVGTRNWPMFFDITCRRGVRTFTCRLRRASGTGNAYPGISVPSHLTYGWRSEGAWLSGGTTDKTDYAWNPRLLNDASHWDVFNSVGTATGRITGLTVGSTGITTGWRSTASGAHVTTGFGVAHGDATGTTPNTGLSGSTQYTVAMWVRCSVARSLRMLVVWRDSSGTLLSTSTAPDFAVAANTWTQVTYTATSPASTARASVRVTGNSGGLTWATNDTLDATGLQIQAGASVSSFFDGAFVSTDSFVYAGRTNDAPFAGSIRYARSGEPAVWITSPIAMEADTDGFEPDPAVDADPSTWDFGFGMLATGLTGDASRPEREVNGYYMTITQTDEVVAI